MNQQPLTMRKPLELGQFIISLIGIIFTAGVLIINQSNKLAKAELRISYLEQNTKDTKEQFDKVNSRLDQIDNQLTSIRVILEDKANRK